MSFEYLLKKPTLEEFKILREAVDWDLEEKGIDDERVMNSLKASPYGVCVYDKQDYGRHKYLIGMVRVSGDDGMYGYIQDTIVLKDYQRKGIGTKMMELLLDQVNDLDGYLLGTCPSKVSVEFYSSFGFKKREGTNPFMYLELEKEKK